ELVEGRAAEMARGSTGSPRARIDTSPAKQSRILAAPTWRSARRRRDSLRVGAGGMGKIARLLRVRRRAAELRRGLAGVASGRGSAPTRFSPRRRGRDGQDGRDLTKPSPV